jgi:PAS domain S-box-containing protein
MTWIFKVAVPVAFLASTVGWFKLFPVKENVMSSALVLEGIYLLASILAYFLILRLHEWLLAIGWSVFTYGLFIDFLDEITLESGFILDVDVIQDVLTTIGLSFIAGGFLSAVRRREKQIQFIRESASQVAAGKERLAVILASVTEGIVVTDANGRIHLMNPAAESLGRTQEPDALGKEIGAIFPLLDSATPPNPMAVGGILQESETSAYATDGQLRSGDAAPQIVELVVTPLRGIAGDSTGRVWVLKDVTAQRLIEREVQNQSRLESIGHLAAGVAHDFNNILAAILNWISFLETVDVNSAQLRNACGEVRGACKRGKSLSTQLLTFSKGGGPVKIPTDLRSLIENEVEFALRGSSVVARFKLDHNLWPAEVDPSQIGQVLQNLTINGRQALPDGGEITVRATNVTIPPDAPLTPLAAGRYIRVEVSDQGKGISRENLDRVFEPYYSTKDPGRGLGLAICHSIVKRHAGCIAVQSKADQGTTFTFHLPATDKPLHASSAAQGSQHLEGISLLVVDDDYSVRNPLMVTLRALGLDVEACAGGDEALALYQERLKRGAPFSVVVIDLTLKDERSGADLMRRLLEVDADAKGIVMTGYHDNPILTDYRSHGFVGGLSKPFDYSSLAGMVRLALAPKAADWNRPRP